MERKLVVDLAREGIGLKFSYTPREEAPARLLLLLEILNSW